MARAVILGGGRPRLHNFNVYFRNRPEYTVVAFTAAQIPDMVGLSSCQAVLRPGVQGQVTS